MKQYFVLIWFSMLILPGCQGQEKGRPVPVVVEKKTTFEEKQKIALDKTQNEAVNAGKSGFNFRYAARKATPGVVHIKSVYPAVERNGLPDYFDDFFNEDFFGRISPPEGNAPKVMYGSASGVIVSDDGYIVTNNHVVNDAQKIEVVLHDGRSYIAKIVGKDPATDLALVKIDADRLAFIQFGNSDSVEVGDMVLAVGNPFNLASTVTAGIVSAKARNINLLTERYAVESYIQTDAAVNQGNSGGALVDIEGKLIGINSAIATPTGAYAGYSFAIPVEMVKKVIDDILRYGKVSRGYLGVIISDMNGDKAKELGIATSTGVFVDSIQKGSAAMEAGILPKDVIIKVNAYNIETVPQFREYIARQKPGEKLALTIIRRGIQKAITVTLKPAQETTDQPEFAVEILKTLGIEIENLSPEELKSLKISGGVLVSKISKGSISRQTNMQEGFVITKINSKPVNNTSEFIQELKNKKGGVLLEGIYPGIQGSFYYGFGL
jgi:serine protease Do